MASYREVSRLRARRIVLWTVAVGVAIVLAFTGVTFWVLRPAWIAPRLTGILSSHLNLETTIDEVSVTLWPRPRISGAGLVMRVPGRPDLPPFIAIGHFWVDAGPLTVWKQRVGTVHLDGLKIAVPPSEVRSKLPGGDDSVGKDVTASKIIVDHLVTHDAELLFVPRRADRPRRSGHGSRPDRRWRWPCRSG